jgi:hypothetical protein
MSAIGEMPMPGGWTMSMAWMRMPGQTWPGAAASFLGMWVVMMVAMMLPSLLPMLWRYRQAVGRTGETHLGRLTALVGVGYLFVWTRVEGDLRAMAVVAAAITVERLVPAGERVARATGGVVVGAGLFLIARTARLGWRIRVIEAAFSIPSDMREWRSGFKSQLDPANRWTLRQRRSPMRVDSILQVKDSLWPTSLSWIDWWTTSRRRW